MSVFGGVAVVDDSYNANPVSMQAALESLAGADAERRFAIVGEMLELGDASDDYHRALAGACTGLDGVYCVGPGTRALVDALPGSQRLGYAETVDQIDLTQLAGTFAEGDRVLVKGSNRVFWTTSFLAALETALTS